MFVRMDAGKPATRTYGVKRNRFEVNPESVRDQTDNHLEETSPINGPAFRPRRKNRQVSDTHTVVAGVIIIIVFLGILVGLEWANLREDWRHIFQCTELQMAFILIVIYGYVYWRQRTRGSRIAANFEKTRAKIEKSTNKGLNRIYRIQQSRIVNDMARCVLYELGRYSYEITPRLYDRYDDWISRLTSDADFNKLYKMWEMFQETNVRQVSEDMRSFLQNGGKDDHF